MKTFKIGDKVKVINNGKRYERYKSWFDENGYSSMLRHEYENTCQHLDTQGLSGQVIATGEHSDNSIDMCAVRLGNGDLILIGVEGLQFINEAKEMTIEEIQIALGHKIKIVE